MKLSVLFDGITEIASDFEINGICDNSLEAGSGDVFFCIKGHTSDGHSYARDAYAKGCRVFCAEKSLDLPPDAVIIKTDSSRKAMALCSSAFCGNPCKELFTIAITGTKGKTSTSCMIKQILEKAGRKVGIIGTFGVVYNDTVIKTKNTTPESLYIHKYCRQMADSGIDTVIFEVSSQGLKDYRTYGIKFDIGVFTNLSPDHIGPYEHASYEEYRECKKSLFPECGTVFFNSDDKEYGYMSQGIGCKIHTFGTGNDPEYKAEEISFTISDGVMKAEYVCDGTFITTNYPGRPGVYNTLCAFAVCDYLGTDRYIIASSLENTNVCGRCETVLLPNGGKVIIDYAHNYLSVNELFSTVMKYAEGKIYTVFGCGGNRSEERRKGMGNVISKYSDVAVITTDNPRNEKLRKISRDIKKGIAKSFACRFKTIYDRKKAIWYCMKKAKEKDIVLVIGKGHEDYMEIGKNKYHYSDSETVRLLADKLRDNLS